MYRTEPPTDKTIREWYMKFQQSGCLCAAKRRGRPGPSAPAGLVNLFPLLIQQFVALLPQTDGPSDYGQVNTVQPSMITYNIVFVSATKMHRKEQKIKQRKYVLCHFEVCVVRNHYLNLVSQTQGPPVYFMLPAHLSYFSYRIRPATLLNTLFQ